MALSGGGAQRAVGVCPAASTNTSGRQQSALGAPTKPPASCAEECGQTRGALGREGPLILFAQSQSKEGLVGDRGALCGDRLVLELTLPFFSRQPVLQEVRTALPGVAIACRRSSQQLQVTELKRQLSMGHWVAWGAEERTALQTARVRPPQPP